MAAAATAQTLPQPILDGIAHCLFPKSRGLTEYPDDPDGRCKSLVPFLGVCSAWRRTFAQLFYRVVLLKVPMFGRPYIPYDGLPSLQDAVDRGYGLCVREIVMRLCSIDHNFVNTEQHQNPLHVVQSCGQLPSVRGLIFRVDPAPVHRLKDRAIIYKRQYRPVPDVEPCDPDRIADLFCSIVDSIMAGMPNIRDVAFYGSDDDSNGGYDDYDSDDENVGDDVSIDPAVVTDAQRHIYDKAFSTISTRMTRVTFGNKEAAEHLSFCPQIDSLTGITTHHAGHASHVSELIRRNSGSLVRLDIDNAFGLDIALLVSSDINPGETCVYPHLKELYARETFETGLASLPQLLVNPFPALEVLHCDHIPRRIAVLVLRENRAQLREVTVCKSVVSEVLRDNLGAEEGAFPCLIKLSLVLLDSRDSLDIYELLGHCPNLSVLKISAIIAVDERPVLRNPPSKLQSLKLHGTKCTVYEAAAIICACPWLTNASFTIYRCQGIEDSPRSDKDIKAFLEKYRGHGLFLRSLQLEATAYRHSSRVCEDAVLLAALFPAISHMGMYGNIGGRRSDNTRMLQEELARSPYKDIVHLKSVNFHMNF